MADKIQVTAITSERPVRRHVTRALAAAGFEVHQCVFDRYEIADHLDQKRDLYLIDGDENTTEAGWLLHQLAIRDLGRRALVFAHVAEHGRLLDLISDVGIHNFVSRHGESTQTLLDERELIVSCQKLVRRDVFGLEKYLGTWGLEIHRRKVDSNSSKKEALAELDRFLNRIVCNQRIMPGIEMVAEELLINAVFVAPRDEQGKPKYLDADRRAVTLEAHEAADFTFGCDGSYLGLSVSDPFGSLTRDVLVRYLKHCFRGTKEKDDARGRGAKLGLYVVFNTATQLVFNLNEGERTEVIALFYIRGGARAFKESGRSLNVFSA